MISSVIRQLRVGSLVKLNTEKYIFLQRPNDLICHLSPFLWGNQQADITMSFGFSVGDFIAAIELANKIRKEFVDAPGQFKAISDECVVYIRRRSLLNIVIK